MGAAVRRLRTLQTRRHADVAVRHMLGGINGRPLPSPLPLGCVSAPVRAPVMPGPSWVCSEHHCSRGGVKSGRLRRQTEPVRRCPAGDGWLVSDLGPTAENYQLLNRGRDGSKWNSAAQPDASSPAAGSRCFMCLFL